jgi:hypothetical protein
MQQTTDLSILDKYTGIYTNRYYLLKNLNFYDDNKNCQKNSTINIDCGRFKATYNIINARPPSSFGLDSWKCVLNKPRINVSFYENDELLFTKTDCTALPCIIMHCLDHQHQTKENTLYSIREGPQYEIKIYNMNNQFIRAAKIGYGPIVDFKRVNQEYGIGITEEMCSYDPFTGLFKLDIFFGETKEDSLKRPYDNSRMHVPLSSQSQDFNYLRFFPLICTETGFIVEDLKNKQILDGVIPYDKVWSQEIFFDDDELENPTDKMYEILEQAGFDINQLKQQVIEKGGVSILAENLPPNILDTLNKKID